VSRNGHADFIVQNKPSRALPVFFSNEHLYQRTQMSAFCIMEQTVVSHIALENVLPGIGKWRCRKLAASAIDEPLKQMGFLLLQVNKKYFGK